MIDLSTRGHMTSQKPSCVPEFLCVSAGQRLPRCVCAGQRLTLGDSPPLPLYPLRRLLGSFFFCITICVCKMHGVPILWVLESQVCRGAGYWVSVSMNDSGSAQGLRPQNCNWPAMAAFDGYWLTTRYWTLALEESTVSLFWLKDKDFVCLYHWYPPHPHCLFKAHKEMTVNIPHLNDL